MYNETAADMARLPHLINTKNSSSSKQASLLAGTTYTYFELAVLYKINCPIFTKYSPSSS
jgi:hypothetical protein